jgi:predicted transcriptional regulator
MTKTTIRAGRVANLHQLTIELDEQLADRLKEAAREHDWTPASLAADCVAQHLEIAVRHRVVIERMEAVDAHIAALAEFVGEATQSGEGIDLTKICRYGRKPRTPD